MHSFCLQQKRDRGRIWNIVFKGRTGVAERNCYSLCVARCCATWSRPCCRWICSLTPFEILLTTAVSSSTSPCLPSTTHYLNGEIPPASMVRTGTFLLHLLHCPTPHFLFIFALISQQSAVLRKWLGEFFCHGNMFCQLGGWKRKVEQDVFRVNLMWDSSCEIRDNGKKYEPLIISYLTPAVLWTGYGIH